MIQGTATGYVLRDMISGQLMGRKNWGYDPDSIAVRPYASLGAARGGLTWYIGEGYGLKKRPRSDFEIVEVEIKTIDVTTHSSELVR